MNKRIKKKHEKWLLHRNFAVILQTMVFMGESEIEHFEGSVVNDLFRFCVLHTMDNARRKSDEEWSHFVWNMNQFLQNIHYRICDIIHKDAEREIVGAAIPNSLLVKTLKKRPRYYLYPTDIMRWFNYYRSKGRFDYFINAVRKTGNIWEEVELLDVDDDYDWYDYEMENGGEDDE